MLKMNLLLKGPYNFRAFGNGFLQNLRVTDKAKGTVRVAIACQEILQHGKLTMVIGFF